MKVKIRKYTRADAPALLALYHNTVHTSNANDYSISQLNAWVPSPVEGIDAWKVRFEKERAVVAEADGTIAGFGSLHNDGTSIGMLYVSPSYQKRGVGQALLEKLEKRIRKKDISTASVETSITAKKYFEHNGYHTVHENRKTLNGEEFLNFIMEKNLRGGNSKMKKKKEKGRINWSDVLKQKLIDLLIVIVGVSAAFQLNNLKLEKDARSLERFYLESLTSDLKKDMEGMDRNLKELKIDLVEAQKVSAQLKNLTVSPDSIARSIFGILGFSTLDKHNNTYNVIINGNGLTVISDGTTRSLVAEYYAKYAPIDRFESVYTELIFRTFAFFYHDIDLTEVKVVDNAFLGKTETKNYLLLIEAQLLGGIDKYEDSLEEGRKLLKAMENNLNK